MLFDFTKIANLNGWEEQSDNVREVGMSKAALVLQKTKIFQRAVFFTMLNPQPNGAGFAGVRTETKLNLEGYSRFQIEMRGQGANSGYKICLRHKGLNDEPHPTYEQKFMAPMGEFRTVELPLDKFEPYYRGKKLDPSQVGYLDVKNITNFEFQIYGGVYSPIKQSGTSSLEINWVKAAH
ncbi:hypothetical protein AAG570_001969 [Ranatra chinensis]|uniref:NADH:ubiquinone oxidoreductase intermediate-associated protein 30 domain-containing protein n=1 Tax=Ranatra chinensis TaxID=642074 RepID=A0ABD0YYA7_9HEMI